MPDITFDYIPTTGTVLQPEGVNKDLYQTTAGRSLFETMNGNVGFPNLDATFEVEQHIIRPGQTGFARTDGRLFSADYFSDLWAGANNTPRFTPIGGACITFRVPYSVSYALFSASVFLTVWRQFGPPNISEADPFMVRRQAPPIYIQTFFGNNNGITNTRRELPQTVFFSTALSGKPDAHVFTNEARTCHHYNIAHSKIAGKASPNDQLTEGYGSFGFAVYVTQNLNGSSSSDDDYNMTLYLNGASSAHNINSLYSGIHRVRTYVRNATVMALL